MAIKPTADDAKQHLEICEFFRDLRVKNGLSQREMGRRMGMAQGNYNRLERGIENGLRLSTIQAWARALGYSVEVNVVPIEDEFTQLLKETMDVIYEE